MSARRVTISVEPEIADAIRAAAKQAGKTISEWLAEAALEKAGFEAKLAAGRRAAQQNIDEYEALHGPVPEEIELQVRRTFAEYGLLQSQREAS